MRVFITGGTGLVGRRLVERLLVRKEEVLVLSRNPDSARKTLGPGVTVVEGAPQTEGGWMKQVDGCDAVVHLAGEPVVGRRWSDVQKTELRNSRIFSTFNVVKAIEQAAQRPKTLVSASAIGYYGMSPEAEFDESSPPGDDFLAKLCVDWEAEAVEARKHGVRVAIIRVGVVLSNQGGALQKMLLPFKMGLGGPAGTGKQWVSWIHLDDLVDLFVKALDVDRMDGPINGTAPEPVRNKEFSQALASALGRPCLFPVPGFALKAMFGEVATVMLEGQRVTPKAAKSLGLQYRFKTVDKAMQDLFGKKK